MSSKFSIKSDKPIKLVVELTTRIDGKLHRFGYKTEGGSILTLQQISQKIESTDYIRSNNIKQVCRYTYENNMLHKPKKPINLDEASQLIALGIPSDAINQYLEKDKPEVIELDERGCFRYRGIIFQIESSEVTINHDVSYHDYASRSTPRLELTAIGVGL